MNPHIHLLSPKKKQQLYVQMIMMNYNKIKPIWQPYYQQIQNHND